ncbi:MAG: nucleotidyltransferase family protein [Oscillospiraceae bacterium]
MHICGIIAEYDPFHTGHARQISAVRQALGADCAVVCVMSGNWTQRGAPAILEKHQRARLALLGGADLVLELPLPYAISSAEWFARGGVSVLAGTGVVTHLCFGSERGDLAPLKETARCLDSVEYSEALRGFLDQGISFPSARQKAARQLIGPAADCLSQPNNNLGVEYLRALDKCGGGITPITVLRQGAGHGEPPRDGFASASYLRRLLREGRSEDTLPYLLPCEGDLLDSSSFSNVFLAERAILARLRQMTAEELAALPDCGEGLSNRLCRAIRKGTGLDEILTLAKTKRYPLARLRRVLLWAYLGLTQTDRPAVPPYLRVLGMNETGRALLREIGKRGSLPVLTKPAHVRRLPEEAQHFFELEARAADLYGLCLPQIPPCGTEWLQGPVIL